MSLRILGTTLLAATGLCGTAAVWHAHQAHSFEARHESRRGQFSREGTPRRMRGGARAAEDRAANPDANRISRFEPPNAAYGNPDSGQGIVPSYPRSSGMGDYYRR